MFRVREILGSMRQRTDHFSKAVQTTKQNQPARQSDDFSASRYAHLLNSHSSEVITEQMKRALHERRERLNRILAGLDPDAIPATRAAEVTEAPGDYSGNTCTVQSTSSSDLSDSSSHWTELPACKTPKPPTLEEIKEAFGSPVGTYTTAEESSCFYTHSSGVPPTVDEGERTEESLESQNNLHSGLREAHTSSFGHHERDCVESSDEFPSSEDFELEFLSTSSRPCRRRRAYSFEESTIGKSTSRCEVRKTLSFDRHCSSHTHVAVTKASLISASRQEIVEQVQEEKKCEESTRANSPVSLASSLSLDHEEPRPHFVSKFYSSTEQRPPKYTTADCNSTVSSLTNMEAMRVTNRNRSRPPSILKRRRHPRDLGSKLTLSFSEDLTETKEHFVSGQERKFLRSYSEDLSLLPSDDSSFDYTNDTGTSGWVSTDQRSPGQAAWRLDLDDDLTDISFLVQEREHERDETAKFLIDSAFTKSILNTPSFVFVSSLDGGGRDSDVEDVTPFPNRPKSPKADRKRVVVFQLPVENFVPAKLAKPSLAILSDEAADRASDSNAGSLYALALASGLNLSGPQDVATVRRTVAPTRFLRLSPDFRCGAQGSLYDIAIRSEFNLKLPWQWAKKLNYTSVRGGLLDTALRSGLTKDLIHSRQPYVVRTRPRASRHREEVIVLPEDISDYECGATGNLYLAFESAGGAYESKGSLYYLAANSGMEVN